MGIIIKV